MNQEVMYNLSALTYDLFPATTVIYYTSPDGVYYGLETLRKF